jgi:hypothetical protein
MGVNWKRRAAVAVITILLEAVLLGAAALCWVFLALMAFSEGWRAFVGRNGGLLSGLALGAATLAALLIPAVAVRLVRFSSRDGDPLSAGGAVLGTFVGLLPAVAAALALRTLTVAFAAGELLDWADWYLTPRNRLALEWALAGCTLACLSLGVFFGSGSRWRPSRRSFAALLVCPAATIGALAPASARLAERAAVSRVAAPLPLGPPPAPVWTRRVTSAELTPPDQVEGARPPALAQDSGGRLYFGAYDVLVALDSEGRTVWEFRPSSPDPRIGQPVLLPEGGLVVGARGGVFSFDRDGRQAWTFPSDARAAPAAVLGAWRDVVYALFPSPEPPGALTLRVLDARSGVERWSTSTPISPISFARDDSGRVYFSSTDLTVFDASGALAWTRPVTGRVQLGLDGEVYLSGRGGLRVFAADGREAWNVTSASQHDPSFPLCAGSGVALGGDAIYFACGGRLFSYGRDGQPRWHRRIQGFLWSSLSAPPLVGRDGTVYVAEQHVWAVSPEGGVKWKVGLVSGTRPGLVPTGTASAGPTLAPDGAIWVGCREGRVLVIEPSGQVRWEYRLNPDDPARAPVTGFFWSGDLVVAESGTLTAFRWSSEPAERSAGARRAGER